MAADDEDKKRIDGGLGLGLPEALVAPGMPPGSILIIVPPEDVFDLDAFGRWLDGALQGGHLDQRRKVVLVKNVGEGESVEVSGEDRSDRRPVR